MGSVMLSGHGSRIIGVVLGFHYAHGMQSLQDPFVGELVGTIQMELKKRAITLCSSAAKISRT